MSLWGIPSKLLSSQVSSTASRVTSLWVKDPQQCQEKDPPFPGAEGCSQVPRTWQCLCWPWDSRTEPGALLCPACDSPVGSCWGDVPSSRGQCKVGRVTFGGHALGQATLGCPCQLLLAQGTALAGTV